MSEIILPRRKFLLGLVGVLAAPAIVKFDNLMRVRGVIMPEPWDLIIHYGKVHVYSGRDGQPIKFVDIRLSNDEDWRRFFRLTTAAAAAERQ